ncbi:MAG: hypothetical protein KF893_19420 [Caldilineaceae bacterium]|nr:hypothetical protein [Caldilineaceae bacterium]
MSQTPTNHPPLYLSELPLSEQILIRLDEIIGLLDRMTIQLEGDLPLFGPGDLVEMVDADEVDDAFFVSDGSDEEEERLH